MCLWGSEGAEGLRGVVVIDSFGAIAPLLPPISISQVRKKDSGEVYAMKLLQKSEVIRRHQVEHTMTERRILVSD